MSMEQLTSRDIEQQIKSLEEKLKKGEIDKDLINKIIERYKTLKDEIIELIEFALEQDRNDRELENIYKRFLGYKTSELIDILRGLGYELSKDENFKKDIENQIYRIIEHIRMGKRDFVLYEILRIFVSNKKKFPFKLLEAFKSAYSDDLFKIFLFSFISGVMDIGEND